jgi:DNA recombination protein RmuC
MPVGIQWIIAGVVGLLLGLLIGWLNVRSRGGTPDLSKLLNELECKLSDEFQKANVDMAARVEKMKGDLRTDLSGQVQQGLNSVRETVEQQLTQGRNEQAQRLTDAVKSLEQKFEALKSATEAKLETSSQQQSGVMKDLSKELTITLGKLIEQTDKKWDALKSSVETKLEALGQQQGGALKDSRTELTATLSKMAEQSDKKLEELKGAVEAKLTQIQADNSAKLEEMRKTVDEKLQGTLNQRLGESFKLVSERLEQVHKGLGDMQALAKGVGDLKTVLSNVKTRGNWGEVQLGNLLEQILTPEQYAANVCTKQGSLERVEFAIKLPGRELQDGKTVWLPIDAKFPVADYERLVDAAERADAEAVEQAAKQLEIRIKSEAGDIRDKYIDPPNTTDFGVLFLPTEGLYAEVLRRPGLAESLQREFRVVVAGPTTLAALLNSLQMGFRTLAIEKRSSEVWRVLGAVKTEFERFGGVIEKVQKKLEEASNVIDTAATRSRAIKRKLKTVTELPADEAAAVLDDVLVTDADTDLPDEPTDKQS